MKNIIKISIISTVVLLFASCNKFLDIPPVDSQNADNYYVSEAAVNANTAALYSALVWQDFHASFMWLAGDELAGDLYYTYDAEGEFFYATFGSGNKFLNAGWNGLFQVVSYCNNIINSMPAAAQKNGVDQAIIDRALGEARCIRGIAYYLLAEYWNDVPIIADNNISNDDIVRNTQSSVYEFIRRDLVFASQNLPTVGFQQGRVTSWTAIGMLAKLHLTMASHLNDANSDENFALAKSYAADVINNSGLNLSTFSTMFYPAGNNNVESLFAIQCNSFGYGYGSTHNANHSRTSRVNLSSNSWGAGKGPTLSLQEAFEAGDARRIHTYMQNGDYFNNLGGGGYSYQNYYPGSDETYSGDLSFDETPNEVLAHIRKYVIGANADCDGKSGANQDAGNNLYILRLADVYLCYVEACIGSTGSTTDALALDVFGRIRLRANLSWSKSNISYSDLLKERRTEFAFEGLAFFDIKRLSYRNSSEALTYLDNMERNKVYIFGNSEYTVNEMNGAQYRHGGFTPVSPDDDPDSKGTPMYFNIDAAPVVFAGHPEKLILPIPDESKTKTPSLNNPPVDYNF